MDHIETTQYIYISWIKNNSTTLMKMNYPSNILLHLVFLSIYMSFTTFIRYRITYIYISLSLYIYKIGPIQPHWYCQYSATFSGQRHCIWVTIVGTADISSFVRFVVILSNPGGRSCAETGINVCINLLFLASKNSCNTDPDNDGASSAANSRIYCKHQISY